MANYYDPKAFAKLPGRSKFDLSYRNSFTSKMAQLIPITCEPVVPGDRFRYGLTYQMQLSPMINPVYDGLEVNFEAFFVPNRILDPKWREFWTGYNEYDQMTPVDIAPLSMRLIVNNTGDASKVVNPPIGVGSLLDFLGYQFGNITETGLPNSNTPSGTDITTYLFNALPVLAYNRIYDDWYRNERTQKASLYSYYNSGLNLRTYVSGYSYDSIENGYVAEENYIPTMLHYRNYKKDRFTTALPEPIIGGDVRIPVNSVGFDNVEGDFTDSLIDINAHNGFSLSTLALGTIQQLKLALKEYQYRMKDTYNGNRYVENLYTHYGVVVPDSTLQRSIYLGSSRDYVNFGEVYQTSAGDGSAGNGALGDYAGRGSSNGTHYLFDESFYECGFFIVLMSISPRSRYFQGAKRFFTRYDRADYFSPEYQNIGDDFITNTELYNETAEFSNLDLPSPVEVFGYNSRWIDLKTRYDELHGEFANPNSPMYNWNFARDFDSAPLISPEFSAIRPINKPFVNLDLRDDNFNVDMAISIDALRPVLSVESF